MTDKALPLYPMNKNGEGATLVAGVRLKFRDEFGWPVGELAARYDTAGSTVQPVASTDRLTLSTGTTANAVCQVLLPLSFAAPAQVVVGMQFSQANPAGCDASLELVDAAGQVCAAVLFAGGSTAAQCRAQTFNKYRQVTADNNVLLTILDRVSAVRLFTIQLYPDEIRFSQRDPNSNNGRNTIAVRTFRVPDPDEQLFLRVKMANGVGAPASSTDLRIFAINITDINELPVDLTNTGGSAASEALPISVVTSTTLGVTPILSATQGGYGATSRTVSAATTNATVAKGASANLGGGSVLNTSAAIMYFKLFNKASAPIVGTDAPILTVIVPANAQVSLDYFVPALGLRLTTGLAWCLTAGAAHTDATAVAAGSIVELFYV